MKKVFKTVVVAALLLCGVASITSCALPFPVGALYTQVMLPVSVGDGEMKFNRIGEATAWSILGWFAGGNASINKAAEDGEITKVTWVSQEVVNVLGIYGSYTTIVYGLGENPDPTVAPATIDQ